MPNVKHNDPQEVLKKKETEKKEVLTDNKLDFPLKDSRPYEERTRTELYRIAKKLGITGRSKMDKEQLINAIRKI